MPAAGPQGKGKEGKVSEKRTLSPPRPIFVTGSSSAPFVHSGGNTMNVHEPGVGEEHFCCGEVWETRRSAYNSLKRKEKSQRRRMQLSMTRYDDFAPILLYHTGFLFSQNFAGVRALPCNQAWRRRGGVGCS